MSEFKLRLLTSRVDAKDSLSAGDKITVGNDEAWFMMAAGTAELIKGQSHPKKPDSIVEREKAEQKAAKVAAASKLRSVHPEGEELAEQRANYEAKIKGLNKLLAERQEQILNLTNENSELVAANEHLQQQLSANEDQLKAVIDDNSALQEQAEKDQELIEEAKAFADELVQDMESLKAELKKELESAQADAFEEPKEDAKK